MRTAVVGGGINGLCSAWRLAAAGHEVVLFERNRLMQATSSASSKLLHGGLRYLESGQFLLVREALRERDGWIERVPSLARPLALVVPIYRGSRRPHWLVRVGLKVYDVLAGRSPLPKSTSLSAHEVLSLAPDLQPAGLVGGFRFFDGQMDDYRLGLWVAEQCRQHGVEIREGAEVVTVATDGRVRLASGSTLSFDRVLNLAGPWAERLLVASGIAPKYRLDTVRGSHLLIGRPCPQALLLEIPQTQRIFFVLPWQGQSLVGTTEVRQTVDEPIACSTDEADYLIGAYNHFHRQAIAPDDVVDSFAGVRPLVKSANDPTHARRDYAFQRDDRLLTVFGGKWTTSLALADKLARQVR